MNAELGPKGRASSKVRESVAVDPMMDQAWRTWATRYADATVKAIKAHAQPGASQRGRQARGGGFRRPRGFWPLGKGRNRRSARLFQAVGGRRERRSSRWMVLKNRAPYAKALEQGAYYQKTGARRPAGKFLRRLYNRRTKKIGVDIAEQVFPETVEVRFRRRRRIG